MNPVIESPDDFVRFVLQGSFGGSHNQSYQRRQYRLLASDLRGGNPRAIEKAALYFQQLGDGEAPVLFHTGDAHKKNWRDASILFCVTKLIDDYGLSRKAAERKVADHYGGSVKAGTIHTLVGRRRKKPLYPNFMIRRAPP